VKKGQIKSAANVQRTVHLHRFEDLEGIQDEALSRTCHRHRQKAKSQYKA
jgi:hypothetical protein